MKWHYVKDEGYPKWCSDIIVKCEDGEVLKRCACHESKRID